MVPMRPSWTSLTLSHSCKCELEARPSSLRAESLPLGPASFQSLVYGAGDAPHDPVQYLMGVGLGKKKSWFLFWFQSKWDQRLCIKLCLIFASDLSLTLWDASFLIFAKYWICVDWYMLPLHPVVDDIMTFSSPFCHLEILQVGAQLFMISTQRCYGGHFVCLCSASCLILLSLCLI